MPNSGTVCSTPPLVEGVGRTSLRCSEPCLRQLPYPYRAMLAVCSDLDETPDRHVYLEIMRFLNTTETTVMGSGVGLEVGNTIYFDMPPGQFAYGNTDDPGRVMVRALIQSGHIDCLHSFGDLATRREHAGRALDELDRHGCKLEVWIDHALAPSNFGSDIMGGSGDVPGSEVYHADLSCAYGIKYVWRGRVTSVIGQDVKRTLRGIFDPRHPVPSFKTLVKEFSKGVLAHGGNVKYAMHRPNELLRPVRLRDDTETYEFLRSNPYWDGVEHAATADGAGRVLTRRMLDRLVEREGVCILYTHLGKMQDREAPFGPRTCEAFRLLAEYHHSGRILVTTTRRLLGYRRTLRELSFEAAHGDDGLRLEVRTDAGTTSRDSGNSTCDLDGLTFYVPEPNACRLLINGTEITDLDRNERDHTGRRSVSIPWSCLEFPEL